MRVRRAPRALAAAALLGCAQGGRATLRPVCAPNDAPAVELRIRATAREYPQFRLRVAKPPGELAGDGLTISGAGDGLASAQVCETRGCHAPRMTLATFGALRSDSSMAVHVSVRPFIGGRRLTWDGVARWQGAAPVCG